MERSELSIEVGSHTIRAAIRMNGKIEKIPLGYSSSSFDCPSVACRMSDDHYIFGDYAKYWVYSTPGNYLHIDDIQIGSEDYGSIYKSLFRFILNKIKQFKWAKPLSCRIVIPAYYPPSDPRKTILKQSAIDAGISDVSFVSDVNCICSKMASLSNGENALMFDFGYSGVTLTIVKRNNSHVEIIKSLRNTELGGRIIDEKIIQIIDMNIPESREMDLISKLMLNNMLAECAEYIKEELSFSDECIMPIIYNNHVFKRSELVNLISSGFSGVLQSCKELIFSAGLQYSDISQIILSGGCSNMPLVEEYILKYFIGNDNGKVRITNCAQSSDYKYLGCLGAFYSNYSSSLLF